MKPDGLDGDCRSERTSQITVFRVGREALQPRAERLPGEGCIVMKGGICFTEIKDGERLLIEKLGRNLFRASTKTRYTELFLTYGCNKT